LILTANSSMTPMSSAMPTTAIGGTPLAGPDFPAGLVTGVFSTSIGGLSGVSGTNSESLAQQLENIKASGARIVSWSVLYDSSPCKTTRLQSKKSEQDREPGLHTPLRAARCAALTFLGADCVNTQGTPVLSASSRPARPSAA
jgi:hypothetical protein